VPGSPLSQRVLPPGCKKPLSDAALILFLNFVMAWGLVHIIGDPIIATCKVLLLKGQAAGLPWFNNHNNKNVSVEFTFSAITCMLTV